MSFTSSETIESFSSHCGAGQARRGTGQGGESERERGEGEAVCCTTQSRSTTTGWLLKGGGGVLSAFVCVCVCVDGLEGGGGGRKRGRGEERVILKLPEQFVTLEWLLSYPGGPPHSRRVFRLWRGERGGAGSSREWSEVMAYSSSGGASVSWGGRGAGAEGGQKRVGGAGEVVVGKLALARAPFSLACL